MQRSTAGPQVAPAARRVPRWVGTIAVVAQPTLHTARITLVPLADEHLELEVELDSDPEVMRFLTGRAATRAEVTARHAGRTTEGRLVDGLGFWVGFVDGTFVGWWILTPELTSTNTVVVGSAELGYRLLRRWWRQGLASEGSRALLRHGFDTVGLTRVFAETMAVNAGSRAVLAAVGLTHVATHHPRFDAPLLGTEHGEVVYELTRDDWSRLRW